MPLRSALILVLACSCVLAQDNAKTPAPAPSLNQDQIRDLIRRTAQNDMENDKRQRDYTYIQREEQHRLDGKGEVKSTETKTSEILEIYGEQVERLIAKDDKPLSEKDAAKEEEKIQKLIDKRKNESDSDREKRLKREEKDRQEELQFVHEVADAYNFRFVGTEKLNGRDNYVVDADPKPGYQPTAKDAKVLTKTRFRVWIDKEDSQVAKLDAEFIDTFSIGLFLARLHKGSHFVIENTRVNDEVWLQRHIAVKLDARVALLKNFNYEVDVSDRDYKKFRTDTKIVSIGDP